MKYRKITAIFRIELLNKVEEALKGLGIKGVTITEVKGYGDYVNHYSEDGVTNSIRIELFLEKKGVNQVVQTIMDSASLNLEGDGIIAVLPVEQLYSIRTKS